ncbi:MAG: hypothetical protein C0628_09530 [Sulfurimonas sp.]|nr:MAG: hypothetical protein C0628_09530 [Sulfurimonas sp.]
MAFWVFVLNSRIRARHSEQSEESSSKVPNRPFASLRVTKGEAQGDGRSTGLMLNDEVDMYMI